VSPGSRAELWLLISFAVIDAAIDYGIDRRPSWARATFPMATCELSQPNRAFFFLFAHDGLPVLSFHLRGRDVLVFPAAQSVWDWADQRPAARIPKDRQPALRGDHPTWQGLYPEFIAPLFRPGYPALAGDRQGDPVDNQTKWLWAERDRDAAGPRSFVTKTTSNCANGRRLRQGGVGAAAGGGGGGGCRSRQRDD